MEFPVQLPQPFLDKAFRLGVRPEDIREQFVRGGGKGGQKINKTSSCVLLFHAPTGIEVRCQKHREQSKNRLSAYKLLLLKIEAQRLGKQSDIAKKLHKIKAQKKRRSRRAKKKMLDDKKRRGELKEARRNVAL